MPPEMSHAITMLATLLDAAKAGSAQPDTHTMQDILRLCTLQGSTLQARLLLTASPGAARYLSLLPAPAWREECWSAGQWPKTKPDCTATQGKPYFSVVTPSYNQGIFLRDTIDGVMQQNFASYEHIVMDGGSTDESLNILRSHPHIIWRSEADRGQTHALNKALALAQGEIIAWINSDDFYLPGTFQSVHDFFAAHPEESVLTGDCLWGWEKSGRLRYVAGEERDFESLIRQWNGHVPGPQPCIFFRRSVLEQTGLGDENMHYGMDYDLWLRMALAGHVRRHIAIPLAFYRFHGLSKSGGEQDWTPFYADWQKCFSKHRHHSKILPTETMLGLAYPLAAGMDARQRATLCGTLKLCAQWKLRDMQLLLISDIASLAEEDVVPHTRSQALDKILPGLGALSLPLRIVPVQALTEENFVRAAVEKCPTFALCMPPISSAIPFESWFAFPINCLVDNPSLPYIPLTLRQGRIPAHPLLPPEGPRGCLYMHRRAMLAQGLGL